MKRALEAVFKHNVLPFDGGRMGAINGMRPNAKKDVTSCQSDEFWTGVTYALGATMIQVVSIQFTQNMVFFPGAKLCHFICSVLMIQFSIVLISGYD